mmetsp:Transcript_71415/g.204862  ORF Transcript_71415/g.204862 Transcript_71415/m.204862 type:complete len:590 (+) Transcript_71415:270-2039(+)
MPAGQTGAVQEQAVEGLFVLLVTFRPPRDSRDLVNHNRCACARQGAHPRGEADREMLTCGVRDTPRLALCYRLLVGPIPLGDHARTTGQRWLVECAPIHACVVRGNIGLVTLVNKVAGVVDVFPALVRPGRVAHRALNHGRRDVVEVAKARGDPGALPEGEVPAAVGACALLLASFGRALGGAHHHRHVQRLPGDGQFEALVVDLHHLRLGGDDHGRRGRLREHCRLLEHLGQSPGGGAVLPTEIAGPSHRVRVGDGLSCDGAACGPAKKDLHIVGVATGGHQGVAVVVEGRTVRVRLAVARVGVQAAAVRCLVRLALRDREVQSVRVRPLREDVQGAVGHRWGVWPLHRAWHKARLARAVELPRAHRAGHARDFRSTRPTRALGSGAIGTGGDQVRVHGDVVVQRPGDAERRSGLLGPPRVRQRVAAAVPVRQAQVGFLAALEEGLAVGFLAGVALRVDVELHAVVDVRDLTRGQEHPPELRVCAVLPEVQPVPALQSARAILSRHADHGIQVHDHRFAVGVDAARRSRGLRGGDEVDGIEAVGAQAALVDVAVRALQASCIGSTLAPLLVPRQVGAPISNRKPRVGH